MSGSGEGADEADDGNRQGGAGENDSEKDESHDEVEEWVESHQCTSTNNTTQQRATIVVPDSVHSFTLTLSKAREETRAIVRLVAEQAGWLKGRAPELWRQAAQRLAVAWPGELHAATEGVLSFWLALHLAGLLPAERLQRWAVPFERLETLRALYRAEGRRYHGASPGITYQAWKRGLQHMSSTVTSDEQTSRLRARRLGFAASCGLLADCEPRSPRGSGKGHPGAPGAAPGARASHWSARSGQVRG